VQWRRILGFAQLTAHSWPIWTSDSDQPNRRPLFPSPAPWVSYIDPRRCSSAFPEGYIHAHAGCLRPPAAQDANHVAPGDRARGKVGKSRAKRVAHRSRSGGKRSAPPPAGAPAPAGRRGLGGAANQISAPAEIGPPTGRLVRGGRSPARQAPPGARLPSSWDEQANRRAQQDCSPSRVSLRQRRQARKAGQDASLSKAKCRGLRPEWRAATLWPAPHSWRSLEEGRRAPGGVPGLGESTEMVASRHHAGREGTALKQGEPSRLAAALGIADTHRSASTLTLGQRLAL